MQNNLQIFHALNHTKVTSKCYSTTTYPSLPLIDEGNGVWSLEGASTQVQTTPKNLFDKSKVTSDKYLKIDAGTVVLGSNADFKISDYIQVSASTSYTLSGAGNIIGRILFGVVLYDINRNYISYIQASAGNLSVPTTSATVYVRFNLFTTNIDITQFELGSTATAYTAYTPPLPSANAESPIINTYKKGTYQNTIGGVSYQYELDNDLLQCGTFKDKLTINTASKTIKIDRNCIQQVLKGDSSDGTWSVNVNTKTNTFFLFNNSYLGGIPVRLTSFCNYMKNIVNAWDSYMYDSMTDYEDAVSLRKAFNFNSSTLGIIATDTSDQKITKLKTWLASRYTSTSLNPFVIQYALATPTSTTRRLTPVTVQSGASELVIENGVNAPIERLAIDGATTQVKTETSPSPLYPSTLNSVGQSGSFNVISKSANLIQNGNFANGVSGWTSGDSTINANNNVLNCVGNGSSDNPRFYQNIGVSKAQKLYVRLKFKINSSVCSKATIGFEGSTNTIVDNPEINKDYTFSKLHQLVTNGSNVYFVIRHHYADAITANGKIMEVKEVEVIDMGKDSTNPLYNLTQAQMDVKFDNWSDYKQTTTNLPYTLRSLPDGTKDRLVIDKTSQTAWIERKIGVKVFNGTELWSVQAVATSTGYSFFSIDSTNYATRKGVSDRFNLTAVWGNLRTSFILGSTIIAFMISNSVIGVIEGDSSLIKATKWKVWLSTNNVTVQYELKTPTIEPITYPNIATIQYLTSLSKDGVASNMSADVLVLGN